MHSACNVGLFPISLEKFKLFVLFLFNLTQTKSKYAAIGLYFGEDGLLSEGFWRLEVEVVISLGGDVVRISQTSTLKQLQL